MNSERLISNIIDVLKEQQIKLGFMKERVRLYYMLSSLNNLLGTKLDCINMQNKLDEIMSENSDVFAETEISFNDERFCFNFPESVSVYVHENTDNTGFIYDFINTVARHGVVIDDVIAEFRKYSDNVHVETMNDEEFDYLVYFEDGIPDSYRYCLKDEGHHMIYHRFTLEDYKEMFD